VGELLLSSSHLASYILQSSTSPNTQINESRNAHPDIGAGALTQESTAGTFQLSWGKFLMR